LDPDFDELQPIERRTGFLGVTWPSVGRDAIGEVADSLRSGWLVTRAPRCASSSVVTRSTRRVPGEAHAILIVLSMYLPMFKVYDSIG